MDYSLAFSEFAKQLSGLGGMSERALVLIVLFHARKQGSSGLSAPEIKVALHSAGLPSDITPKTLRTMASAPQSGILKQSDGLFSLSHFGDREVGEFVRERVPEAESTRRIVNKIPISDRVLFEEAIVCIEAGARRAAVVTIWIAVLRHLRQHILKHQLIAFNAALKARTDYLNTIQIAQDDDFDDIKKESEFILILKTSNAVTHDERKLLDDYLGLRNTAAHPNGAQVSRSRAAGMLEELVENFILKYPT